MTINENTIYADVKSVERYFTADAKEQIIQASQRCYKNYQELTIEEFFEIIDKNYELIEYSEDKPMTLYQYYWLQGFASFVDEFQKILKRFEITPTAKEMQCMQGTLPMTFSESLLVFAQNFFNLKSFGEAEKLTIGDIIIAKKADYNRNIFQRNQIKNIK